MKRALSCLLAVGLFAGGPPLCAALEDDESPGIFASYADWAASEAGKAALAKLEEQFWGGEENEAFVNKLIDWGKIPRTNVKLGKVLFLPDSDFKSKVAQQVSAFGSIEKILSTLEFVDRISAGEWAEAMQEAATSFLTEAATNAVPVLGQLKMAYDIAKIGWDAFMGEIYDLNVQQLYKVYSREKMDWPTFQERFQAQLGYGDAPMDQFTQEFAGKNGYSGLTKDDFAGFKKGDKQAKRTIDSITRILYNKFKDQCQKELNAAAQARAAKQPLEDAAWVMAYSESRDKIRTAVEAEMKKRAEVEFAKQKAALEKWAKWRVKEKAMEEAEAKARAEAGPGPTAAPVEIPFSGLQVPDTSKLVGALDSIVAEGAIPDATAVAPYQFFAGQESRDLVGDGRADSGYGVSVVRYVQRSGGGANNPMMKDFFTQLFDLEEGFYKELAKAHEAVAKQQTEQRKSYEQRLDALERVRESCKQDIYNNRAEVDKKTGSWEAESNKCFTRYDSAKDALDKSMAPVFAGLGKEIEKAPKLDLEPVYKRFQYWTERYRKSEAAESAASEALSAMWFELSSPARVDTRGSFKTDSGETVVLEAPVEYRDPVDDYAKPRLDDAKSQIRQACAEAAASVANCAEVLRKMAEGPLTFSLSTQESEGKSLEEFRKAVAKAKAARPRAGSACRGLYAAAEGTGWAQDQRGNCSAALATFDDKLILAADQEMEQTTKIANRGARAGKEGMAVAMVQEFKAQVEAAQAVLEGAAGLPIFSSDQHPYDWLLQAGETGNLSTTYLPGLDEKGLSAVRAEVSGLLKSLSGWGQQYVPGPYMFFSNLQAALKAIQPVPKDALVYNNSLVTVEDMRDIASSANLIDPVGRHAVSHGASLRKNLQSFILSPQDIPEKHPVRAAYDSALEAIAAAEARIENSSMDRVKAAQKKGGALSAAIAKLKDAAAKNKASSAELARLRKELDALQKDLDALSGKEREESRVDTQELMKELLECEAAIQEASRAKKQDDAMDKLRDIEERMAGASAAAAQALLNEAAKVAQEAGIGGRPEVGDLMRRLADLAGAKSRPPARPGPPAMPGAPPHGGAGGGDPQEAERAAANFLEDLKELKGLVERNPGGAQEDDNIERALERGRTLMEDAGARLRELDPGSVVARLSPLQSAFKDLEQAAQRKRHATAAPGGPAGADLERIPAVHELYKKFAAAFAAKDLAGILDCLTEDWESSEGIGLSDMESTLGNSFSAFDSVRMDIQNLQIRPLGQGKYQASYSTHLTGNIRQNDIKHEEKSTHTDTVVFTKDGPRISRTTGSTGWVQ
jgi:hypothetical protein